MGKTNKTAIIIGATGLTGSELLRLLLQNDKYSRVKVFSRRTTGIKHPKLEEHIVNFDDMENWANLITGDVLFSALGTTIKKAGSKSNQYKIDFEYQYNTAKFAAANGVDSLVLVSSLGANADSKIFYSKIKGELEQAVKPLPFKSITILQPSILAGKRNESRINEKLGIALTRIICKLPGLRKYHPIHAKTVASAMILSEGNEGYHVLSSVQIATLGKTQDH